MPYLNEIVKLEDVSFHYHEHLENIQPDIPPVVLPVFMMVSGTGNVFDPDPLSSANADYNDTGFPDNNDNASTQLDAEMMSKTLQDITFDGTNYNLVGPWAEIVDFESPFRGLFAQASSDWNFDRNDNAFEAANTYYHVDESVRYLNVDLGLNIRPDAYSGGVQFDPHGFNGQDNSHYLGSSQRISFGEGGVDDAEDSDVIHHELGHGLHDWVTNGGLSQVQGLSEGSGDYWAASYNRYLNDWAPSDDQYNWVFNWDGHNEFWSGRVVDFPGTYLGNLSGSIHNQGQVWSTCMINVWDELGRTQTDKAFWEGLGDTNGSSNQDVAANAVYQAAIDMGYSNAEIVAMHEQMTNTGYVLPDAPLPIELSSFSGIKQDKSVYLFWITASESKNDFFTIERSADGHRFTPIGQVNAIGDHLENIRYEFTDATPLSGTNYYRLKQTDNDGSSTYSTIISIDFDDQVMVRIFPNPVTQTLFIQSDILDRPEVRISIFNASGNEISSFSQSQLNSKTFSIDISPLTTGFYVLKIDTAGESLVKRFFRE